MRKVKSFTSYDEYEKWEEQFEESCEEENYPVYIDNGWDVKMDMFAECKNWKTAIRRFEKTFAEINPEVLPWAEQIMQECEEGNFTDVTGWKITFSYDEEENEQENLKSSQTFGSYGWGVEQLDENRWYIFLNISGAYAGKPERTAA